MTNPPRIKNLRGVMARRKRHGYRKMMRKAMKSYISQFKYRVHVPEIMPCKIHR